jgi:hypothetical protein
VITDYLIGALAATILVGVIAAFAFGGAIGGVTATCLVVVGWIMTRLLPAHRER